MSQGRFDRSPCCACLTPNLGAAESRGRRVGTDGTNGRFGDVWLDRCPDCGRHWLFYRVEYEAFSKSGRWYRAVVSEEVARRITPEGAVEALAASDYRIRGGSFFGTSRERDTAAVSVDLPGAPAPRPTREGPRPAAATTGPRKAPCLRVASRSPGVEVSGVDAEGRIALGPEGLRLGRDRSNDIVVSGKIIGGRTNCIFRVGADGAPIAEHAGHAVSVLLNGEPMVAGRAYALQAGDRVEPLAVDGEVALTVVLETPVPVERRPKYDVYLEENSHHGDAADRTKIGAYDDEATAIEACKSVIDGSLEEIFRPGMSAEALYRQYTVFGADAHVVPAEGSVTFSGWDYARARCAEIARGGE